MSLPMKEFPPGRSVFISQQSQNIAILWCRYIISRPTGATTCNFASERMRSVKSTMDAGSSAWAGLVHQKKLNAFSFLLLINFG